MMSRYKLNINHSEDDQKSADSKDEILIKRDGIQKYGVSILHQDIDDGPKLSEQFGGKNDGGWKEVSIIENSLLSPNSKLNHQKSVSSPIMIPERVNPEFPRMNNLQVLNQLKFNHLR